MTEMWFKFDVLNVNFKDKETAVLIYQSCIAMCADLCAWNHGTLRGTCEL